MSGVLEGIRVLDYGRYIAGPWCAALLGDLGAEVIRVEKVDGGEDRFVVASSETDGSGAMFMQLNRNKLGITLNPTSEQGQEVQRRLVESADIVVANMPERALKGLGLDYASLCAIRPDIILVSNTCFGTNGPYGTKLGFDGLAQAMCGNMHMSGTGEAPTRSYSPWVDFGTAGLCAFGAMAALMSRNQTGKGQEVQGSLLGTALTTASPMLIEQQLHQVNREASGNRSQTSGPGDVFRTSDGHILVAVVGAPMYKRWATLMGDEDLLTDPRFKDDDARGIHSELLSQRMQAWCETRTTEDALAELEGARVPAGPVYRPQETLDDPHVQQGGFLQGVDYPGLPKPAMITSTPVKLLGTPGEIRMRAPQLGEHNEQVLGGLGYSGDEISALRGAGVI